MVSMSNNSNISYTLDQYSYPDMVGITDEEIFKGWSLEKELDKQWEALKAIARQCSQEMKMNEEVNKTTSQYPSCGKVETKMKTKMKTKVEIKKRVTFSLNTKKHDGLNPVNYWLDLIIWKAMNDGVINSVDDLLNHTKGAHHLLKAIRLKIHNMRTELKLSQEVNVLPQGGGHQIKLKQRNRRALRKVEELLNRAIITV